MFVFLTQCLFNKIVFLAKKDHCLLFLNNTIVHANFNLFWNILCYNKYGAHLYSSTLQLFRVGWFNHLPNFQNLTDTQKINCRKKSYKVKNVQIQSSGSAPPPSSSLSWIAIFSDRCTQITYVSITLRGGIENWTASIAISLVYWNSFFWCNIVIKLWITNYSLISKTQNWYYYNMKWFTNPLFSWY